MFARKVVVGLALLTVLALSACGSSSKSSATTTASETVKPPTTTNPEPQPDTKSEPKSDTGGFSGQDATNYEHAKAVCGSRPRARVATKLGLAADAIPRQIAQKYSEGHQGAGKAVFEGCLAGARSP